MKKISVLFILCVLMISCNDNDKPEKPDNLISKNKMEQILYDLYIINAAKGVNRKLMENNGIVPEAYILKKHNIDSTQFADSNSYYAFSPDTYKTMVENVKAKLEKQKKVLESLEKKEGMAAKRRRDSIKEQNKKNKDSTISVLKNQLKN